MSILQTYIDNAVDTRNYPLTVETPRLFLDTESSEVRRFLYSKCKNRFIRPIELCHIEHVLKKLDEKFQNLDGLIPRLAIEMTSQNVQRVSRSQGIYAHVVFLELETRKGKCVWLLNGYIRGRFNDHHLTATNDACCGVYGEFMLSGDSQELTMPIAPPQSELKMQIAAMRA